MQWIAGQYFKKTSSATLIQPKMGRIVGDSIHPLWNISTPANQIRVVAHHETRTTMTVVGTCLATDSELQSAVMNAVSQQGKLTVPRWPGAYIVILQNLEEVIVFGDLSGANRIYFIELPEGYVWTNAATPLGALINSSINWSFLALDLVTNRVEKSTDSAPFHGVRAVPPGSLMRFSPKGAAIERWYTPRTTASYATAAYNSREALLDSVQRRAESSAVLSGDIAGIDSSTLAALAARHRPIHGFTYTDNWLSQEDVWYAKALVASLPSGQIVHHILEGGHNFLRYSGIEGTEPIITDLPSIDVAILALTRFMRESIKESGSTDHMSGEAGDMVLHANPSRIVTQFNFGERRKALAAVYRLARDHHLGVSPVIKAILRTARMSYAEAVRELAESVLHDGLKPDPASRLVGWCQPSAGADWLTKSWAYNVREKLYTIAEIPSLFENPSELHDWLDIHSVTSSLSIQKEVYAQKGVVLHKPFLDSQVLEAALSLPGYLRVSPYRFKRLATQNLADVLPQVLVGRGSKVDFTRSATEGIKHNATWLRHIIATSQLVEAGVIDGTKVSEAFESAFHGLARIGASLRLFIAMEYWLAHLNLQRASWWEKG